MKPGAKRRKREGRRERKNGGNPEIYSQNHADGRAIRCRRLNAFELVMCIKEHLNHAMLACVILFFVGMVLPFGVCQNAEPCTFKDRNITKRSNFSTDKSYISDTRQHYSRNASSEEKNVLEENRGIFPFGNIVNELEAEAEVKADIHAGKHKNKLLLLLENAVKIPFRRNVNITTFSKQQESNFGNRARKKRRRGKESRSPGFKENVHGIIEGIRENEARNKRGQLSQKRNNVPSKARPKNWEVRKSRVEYRRRRKKDNGRNERKRNRKSSRQDDKQQDARRSSKYKRKTYDDSTRFLSGKFSDRLIANTPKYPIDKSLNVSPDHNSSKETISTTMSSNLQHQPILEATKTPTRTTPRRGIYADTVEREFSKQLEMEIFKSGLKDPSILQNGIFDGPLKKSSGQNIPSVFAKKRADKDIVPVNSKIDFGNSRYDAEKMLGYSRTEEDLPILDLENEVLARTLKDYNAYMTSSLKSMALPRYDMVPSRRSSSPHPQRKPIINSEESDEEPEGNAGSTITRKPTEDDSTYGDLSCINGTFLPAPLSLHALIKYVKSSTPGNEYLEADYECVPGFYMVSSTSRLVCRNRQWVGQMPKCKIKQNPNGLCAEASCEHVCTEINGYPVCSCYKGFRLDGHKCIDVNECDTLNAGCEYKCTNIPGSFRCECPNGMKQGRDKFTCTDINECLLNNGHGPCQDTCRNLIGGYECSCEGLQDTALATDNHTCKHTGPCSVNNAGCSHTCLSTMGRVFCLCPDGFMLEDDWKTCQDVDECSVPDLQTDLCRYGCINTPGSYRCAKPMEMQEQPVLDSLSITCLPGYEQTPHGTCIDINECVVDNGGCMETCENTDGSFFCACNGDERALSSDGKSCVDMNSIVCLPLDSISRGYLECSRSTTSKLWRDRRKVTNRPGTKCFLKCPRGYQLRGEYELTCRSDGTWDGPKHGKCIRYSKPRLECPKDVIAELPPGRDEAFVTFDQPATDLDWFRYVRSKPSWGTRLEANLKCGVHEVTFFAKHPISKKQASCILRIIVKGGEAPKVKDCPRDIEVIGRNGTTITWTEPIFTDNVKVTQISNNENPGRRFDIGGHRIEYEASDEAGWSSKCVFTVVLRQE